MQARGIVEKASMRMALNIKAINESGERLACGRFRQRRVLPRNVIGVNLAIACWRLYRRRREGQLDKIRPGRYNHQNGMCLSCVLWHLACLQYIDNGMRKCFAAEKMETRRLSRATAYTLFEGLRGAGKGRQKFKKSSRPRQSVAMQHYKLSCCCASSRRRGDYYVRHSSTSWPSLAALKANF